MITTSSVDIYSTKKIKASLNTQISELSFDGVYNYFPMPTLKLIQPNGGQTFFTDSKVTIEWYTYAWETLKSSSLYYTFDNNRTRYPITESFKITEPTSSYTWDIINSVDRNFVLTSSYKIIVCGSYDNTAIIDSSLREFSIVPRNIKILDNGMYVVISGKNNIYPITWASLGTSGTASVEAQFVNDSGAYLGGENFINITSSYIVPDTKNYNWTVPESNLSGSFVIKVWDTENPTVYSISNILTMASSFIQNIDGCKLSFPRIGDINTQGIFKFAEYYILIKSEFGEAYYQKSLITLTGSIGNIYNKPFAVFSTRGNGLIFGEKYVSI